MASPIIDEFRRFLAGPKNLGRFWNVFGETPRTPLPILGGRFFWDALAEEQGYKLQKNKIIGHFRILDPEGMRIAWGSEAGLTTRMRG